MRPGGQPNMQQIMKQAQKMQQQVAEAQAELAAAELTGTAGGGLVTVTVTGLGEYKSVTRPRRSGSSPRKRWGRPPVA
jgi:DNA-binding YbaB/EbfC family protein